jgi:hypothetical protein
MKTPLEVVNVRHGAPAHQVVGLGPHQQVVTACGVRLFVWRFANRTAPACKNCRRARRRMKGALP